MSDVSNGGKRPVTRERRWVVVGRRPRAAAHFLGPFTFERAVAEAGWLRLKWEDAAVAVYELDQVVA